MHRKINMFKSGDAALEYSVIGEGIPILLLHGGHSGCREEFGYDRLLASGFSIITPSRAGYGRTSPIADLGQACRLYQSLLDHCPIRKYGNGLTAIQAPTLIMHSQNDGSVPLSHPENAKALIPRSELCILDSWGHLLWIGKHAAEYDDALVSFLSAHYIGCH